MTKAPLSQPELKDLLNKYGLDEKGMFIDEKGLPWFSRLLLADLMEVNPATISNNANEIWDWGILDKTLNLKILTKKSGDPRGRGKHYYSLDVLTQLGMTLKSKPARKFQKQIRKLFKGLYTGDLSIVSKDQVFNAIAAMPTTKHRKKINEQMISQGLLTADIELRCYNVKLNTTLRYLIKDLGYGGLISHIQKRMGKAIYKMTPAEYRELHGITDEHRTRDYCSADQWMVAQFIEKELYKMIINYEGEITSQVLLKFAEDCTQRGKGLWSLMEDNESIKRKIATQQSRLKLE